MKIAIIGSGIAGLTAAWLISQQHQVTIYERSPRLGMDANGFDIDLQRFRNKSCSSNGCSPDKVRVDVPLRVFSEAYYPNLISLFKEVGVEYQPEDYSSSFSLSSGKSIFGYKNWLLGSISVPIPSPPSFFDLHYWHILYQYLYFLRASRWHLSQGKLSNYTFKEYLVKQKYSEDFQQQFMIPSVAAICTCSFASVEAYPAHIIIHYLLTRSMRGVRKANGGAETVVLKLSEKCHEIKCNTAVESVKTQVINNSKQVKVSTKNGNSDIYYHAIIATQANQALSLLPEIPSLLSQALSSFVYEKSELILHMDDRLMPKNRSDWRSVNFILEEDLQKRQRLQLEKGNDDNQQPRVRGESMATIWMNRVDHHLHPIKDIQIFQTWNPFIRPQPNTILCKTEFERPVVTFLTIDSMKQLSEYQGKDHLWFCGSYSVYGLPLLETAVTSAVEVASSLGVACPWAEKLSLLPKLHQNGQKTGLVSQRGSAFSLVIKCMLLFMFILFIFRY